MGLRRRLSDRKAFVELDGILHVQLKTLKTLKSEAFYLIYGDPSMVAGMSISRERARWKLLDVEDASGRPRLVLSGNMEAIGGRDGALA